MARVLQEILLVFAMIDISLVIKVIFSDNRGHRDNIYFAVYAFFGAMWCLFFGLLLVQTDDDAAFLCRCLGLIGTFFSFISAAFLFARWSDMPRRITNIFSTISCLSLIIYPFTCRRDYITFVQTSFGTSYSLTGDIWNTLYNISNIILAAIFVIYIINMLHSNKRRLRRMGKLMLAAIIMIAVGAALDTLLPVLGYPAIPGSTFMQFFGTLLVYSVLSYSNRNRITVGNMANQLFYSINTPILVYNEKHMLELVSDEAHRYLEIGSNWDREMPLNAIFTLDTDPLTSEEQSAEFNTAVRKTGADCLLVIDTLRDDYGDVTGYFAIIHDTTERERFIEELESARTRADEANRAKSVFLANMSHEIRTPINTVLGMNEMILRESDSEDVRGYAENIYHAGETLLSIINDILDFSKVEAGMMEIVEDVYAPGHMLIDLSDMFKLRAHEKGLEFLLSVDEAIPRRLYGDEIRIRQVLINLLSNAIKYTMRGHIALNVRLVNADSARARIRFEVKDTGIGIKEEDRAALFESFTRLDGHQNHHIEGTGLGLNIVKALAEMMDAELKVESVYGVGSVFSFELGQKIVDAQPIGDLQKSTFRSDSKRTDIAGFTAEKARLLVVDDNRMNLEVIKGLLKRTKVQLDTADSGQACLEKAATNRYDIILLDHMMPNMDGIETRQRLADMDPKANLSHDAVIIALTANAVSGAKEMYLEKGFADYLSKPVEAAKLEAMLCKYLPAELVSRGENAVGTATDGRTANAAGRVNENESAADRANASSDISQAPVSLKDILTGHGIDYDTGMRYCQDEELYKLTAQTFATIVDETCVELERCRNEGDIDSYRVTIHAVKSNARTLGANALYEYALSQEEACKSGNFGIILADADRPETLMRKLRDILTLAFPE